MWQTMVSYYYRFNWVYQCLPPTIASYAFHPSNSFNPAPVILSGTVIALGTDDPGICNLILGAAHCPDANGQIKPEKIPKMEAAVRLIPCLPFS